MVVVEAAELDVTAAWSMAVVDAVLVLVESSRRCNSR